MSSQKGSCSIGVFAHDVHGVTLVFLCCYQVIEHFAEDLAFQDMRRSYLATQLPAAVPKGRSSGRGGAAIRAASPAMGGKYYLDVLSREYAARVTCWHTYDRISQDVLHRWTYPFVPDTHLLADTKFLPSRRGIYLEDGAVIARDAVLGQDTLVGTRPVGVRCSPPLVSGLCLVREGGWSL